jgi:hypothetical protein
VWRFVLLGIYKIHRYDDPVEHGYDGHSVLLAGMRFSRMYGALSGP